MNELCFVRFQAVLFRELNRVSCDCQVVRRQAGLVLRERLGGCLSIEAKLKEP